MRALRRLMLRRDVRASHPKTSVNTQMMMAVTIYVFQ